MRKAKSVGLDLVEVSSNFKGFLGLSMKQAIATSLAVMIVTASVSSFRYAQAGLVDWRIASFAAIAAVVAALLGSEIMKSLSSDSLRFYYCACYARFAWRMGG